MFDHGRFVGDPTHDRRRPPGRSGSGVAPCRPVDATADHSAFGTLRDRIIDGTLRPGARLRIRGLAAELGFSPTTVRGAVNRLAAIGLVTQTPDQGPIVADLSAARLAELFGARLVIEPATARLGAEAIDARGLAELRHTLDAQSATDVQRDVLLQMQLDMAFLRRLYAAAGNATLTAAIERIWQRAMPFALFRASIDTDGAATGMRLDGRALLAACEAHDGAEVERLRAASLKQASARLAELLRHRR